MVKGWGGIKEKDGVIVGTFIAGNSFGETALTKTKHGLHRRASVVAKKPSILLRIGTKEYIKVQRKMEKSKTKINCKFSFTFRFFKTLAETENIYIGRKCMFPYCFS